MGGRHDRRGLSFEKGEVCGWKETSGEEMYGGVVKPSWGVLRLKREGFYGLAVLNSAWKWRQEK